MTAAAPKVGSSVDSDSDQAQSHPESWPLPGPGPRAGSIDDGDHARQHDASELGGRQQGQQQQPEPGKGQGKRPWWRRRIAIWSFAVAAVLLVAFVVLLTLGLLGYLKVGSFSTRNSSEQASSDSEQRPPNPLSTIPLLSEPTFTYVAPAPPPITVTPAAATPIPTNLGTLNIVRYAMICRCLPAPCGLFLAIQHTAGSCHVAMTDLIPNRSVHGSHGANVLVTHLPTRERGSLLFSCLHTLYLF